MSQPDWRNPQDYTFAEKLDGPGWAWEFLRRNLNYRQDWDIASERQIQFDQFQKGSQFNTHNNPFAMFDPPLAAGQTPVQWILQSGVECNSPLKGYGKLWGLERRIQNPTSQDIPAFKKLTGARMLHLEECERFYYPVDPDSDQLEQLGNIAVLAVDLKQPDTSITEAIKNILNAERRKRCINKISQRHFSKRENWITYLRIMDAITEGEPNAVIAKVLFSDLTSNQALIRMNKYLNIEIEKVRHPDYCRLLAHT